ncbi:MAG: hypothetical protein J5659_04075 [Clostridia bacterium]|nr:hypothetical protein [Clostridia bacterium]
MITISPIGNKMQIDYYFQNAGLKADYNSGCVEARLSDKVIGYCLYNLYDKGITIFRIIPENDVLLADGILRSTLYVAAQRCAMDARYEGADVEILLEKLDFILDKSNRTIDIDKLFRGCSCNV